MRFTIIVLALLSAAHAQKFRFAPVSESVVLQREGNAPASRQDREARIKQLFSQAGCKPADISEQQLEKFAGANVVCRLPGKSKQAVIVGATLSQVAPDNWTGASLLPSLFQTLAGRKRHHTFIFVAFADGSSDLAGSEFFAAHMSKTDVDHTEAMINLEALGFSPTKVSSGDSDKDLVQDFMKVTYALKLMASQVDVSKGVREDSAPFASLHIPEITIHSLTLDAVADLHSQEKDPVEFRADHYYNSYRLVSGYLAFLDETLKPRRHSK